MLLAFCQPILACVDLASLPKGTVHWQVCKFANIGYCTLHTLILDFFPFGIDFNDTIGPRAVDAATDVILLDIPVAYNLKNHYQLFVCDLIIITGTLCPVAS